MRFLPLIPVRYVPRRISQFSDVAFSSRSSVTETLPSFQNGDDTPGVRRRKSLCAKASRCPRRFSETPHSRSLHGDATKALSLLARTPKPRDARARNSSSRFARRAAHARPVSGVARGPGPTAALFSDRRSIASSVWRRRRVLRLKLHDHDLEAT